MLDHCADPFSKETLREWKEKGYIDAGVNVALPWLMDVACGRLDFVTEIVESTSAWNELMAACRELRSAGLDSSADPDSGGGSLTRHQQLTADLWLRANSVDVPWMREWIERVVLILGWSLEDLPSDDAAMVFRVLLRMRMKTAQNSILKGGCRSRVCTPSCFVRARSNGKPTRLGHCRTLKHSRSSCSE